MQLDIEPLHNGVIANGEVGQHRSFVFSALYLGVLLGVLIVVLTAFAFALFSQFLSRLKDLVYRSFRYSFSRV